MSIGTKAPVVRFLLIFLLAVSAGTAAPSPRAVAEETLAAWRTGDAQRLDAVAHPELKQRCHGARIVQFYLEGKAERKKAIAGGSDTDALVLFCEALRAVVPRDDRLEYFDRFIETASKGDLAIVVFESGWRAKNNPLSSHSSQIEVVLKKVGDDWKFLWSPAAQIHIDLTWDPTK